MDRMSSPRVRVGKVRYILAAAIAFIGGNGGLNSARAAAITLPLASGSCHGDIGGTSGDPTDLPAANFDENLAFLSTIAAGPTSTNNKGVTGLVTPLKKGGGAIGGAFFLTIDFACPTSGINASTTPPCLQAGSFTGTITTNGVAMVVYSDLPGVPLGTDPLDGCQQTFQLNPYSSNSAGYAVGTSLLTQAPTVTVKGVETVPPRCKALGTRFIVGCTISTQ